MKKRCKLYSKIIKEIRKSNTLTKNTKKLNTNLQKLKTLNPKVHCLYIESIYITDNRRVLDVLLYRRQVRLQSRRITLSSSSPVTVSTYYFIVVKSGYSLDVLLYRRQVRLQSRRKESNKR